MSIYFLIFGVAAEVSGPFYNLEGHIFVTKCLHTECRDSMKNDIRQKLLILFCDESMWLDRIHQINLSRRDSSIHNI